MNSQKNPEEEREFKCIHWDGEKCLHYDRLGHMCDETTDCSDYEEE